MPRPRIPVMKRKVPTTIGITIATLEELDEFTSDTNNSRSEVVEDAVKFYLADQKDKGNDRKS